MHPPIRCRKRPRDLYLSRDGIFYTLQGEGITCGLPAVFVRLQQCNLRCSFCDTKYARSGNGVIPLSIRQAATRIRSLWPPENCQKPRCVITGGEPLLQQSTITMLLRVLPQWEIEIETNGTILPSDTLLRRCQFNCSPKLSYSGIPKAKRLHPAALLAIDQARSRFKFVVRNDKDIDEMETDFRPYISSEKIILVPEGTEPEQTLMIARKIVKHSLQCGYRLIPRLHIYLWPNRTGI